VESLSDEVASLVKDGEDHFKITRSVIQNLRGDWKHFLRKAVYTYKVVKGFPQLESLKRYPSIDKGRECKVNFTKRLETRETCLGVI
jgi:hypothetical protein